MLVSPRRRVYCWLLTVHRDSGHIHVSDVGNTSKSQVAALLQDRAQHNKLKEHAPR
jgi:hypothetical protein